MKRLLTILCLLTAFAVRAADSTIGNLGAISTVPDSYVTVWENSGVSDVKITFLNLTNQVLAGYLSLGYANTLYDVLGAGTTAAHNATNNFPWGVLYDASGAAHNATNGFPWGVLYDAAGAGTTAAHNATNGFLWGSLYDVAGAATAVTNTLPAPALLGLVPSASIPTITAAQMPALTGDVTTTAGTVATHIAAALTNNFVLTNDARPLTLSGTSIGGNAASATTAGTAQSVASQGVNVMLAPYSAYRDGYQLTNCWMTSGSRTLTCTQATFVAGDIGKYIRVTKAGSGVAGLTSPWDLSSGISNVVDSHTLTLSNSAGYTITNTMAYLGHDDTPAIQAAVTFVTTNGGGIVYCPQSPTNFYTIAGPFSGTATQHAQIFLPDITTPGMLCPTVVIAGDNAPGQGGLTSSDLNNKPMFGSGGTMWVDTLVGDGNVNACLFRSGLSTGDGSSGIYNNVRVTFRNMGIIVAANPQMNGLNLFGASCADIHNIYIGSGYVSYSGPAQTAGTAGIITPSNNNSQPGVGTFEQVVVSGFSISIDAYEHTFFQNVFMQCASTCGLRLNGGHIYTASKMLFQECVHGVQVNGSAVSTLDASSCDFEEGVNNAGALVFVTTADIFDSGNYLHGYMYYGANKVGSASPVSALVTGATNFWLFPKNLSPYLPTVLIPPTMAAVGINAGDINVFNGSVFVPLPLGQYQASAVSTNSTAISLLSVSLASGYSAYVHGTFLAAGSTNTAGYTLSGSFSNPSTITNIGNTLISSNSSSPTGWTVNYTTNNGTNIVIQATGGAVERVGWSWQGTVQNTAIPIQPGPPWTDTYFPTNVSAPAKAIGWWVANNITTAGGVAVTNWPDYSGNAWNLTNSGVTAEFVKSNSWINGFAIVHAKAAGSSLQLINTTFTNYPTCEVVVVANVRTPSDGSASMPLFNSVNSSYGYSFLMANSTPPANQTTVSGFGGAVGGPFVTNRLAMYDIKFSTTAGQVWTNNVADSTYGTTANCTTTGWGGIRLQPWGNNADYIVDYAEIIIYTNALITGDRTLLWQYETNKYPALAAP